MRKIVSHSDGSMKPAGPIHKPSNRSPNCYLPFPLVFSFVNFCWRFSPNLRRNPLKFADFLTRCTVHKMHRAGSKIYLRANFQI